MKCYCCDKRLTPSECVQKHGATGDYLDMCNKCLDGLGIPVLGNEDNIDEIDVDTLYEEEVINYNDTCINYERDTTDEWDNL